MQTISLVFFIALALATSPVSASEPVIPDFEATYSLHRSGLTFGESVRQFKSLGDGRYQFESRTRSVGFAAMFIKEKIYEQSLLSFSAQKNRLLPDSYQYVRSGKKEHHVKLSFDRENNRVVNRVNDDPWVMDIPEDTLDKFGYQLQIMLDAGEKKHFQYQIADGGKLKQYDIEVIGTEMLKTAIGTYEVVVLQRSNDKRQTTMWCAKELHYLPVKITQKKRDGGEFRAEIKKLTGLGR